jgi:NADH-quinone oxidoreductase subunit F
MVMQRPSRVKYAVCNVAEDEPGTFKDQYLLRDNPHQLIEGILIAAHTVGAETAYLYINKNFEGEIQIVRQALQEAMAAGHFGDIQIEMVQSPGTYVAGEETAVLEVIEGRVAAPRQKPPYYPAAVGLYGMPTLVNNAETLSNLPHILREGPDWFQALGTPAAPGTLVFTLTGDVNHPGLYERPIGTSLRTLIETCGGGICGGHRLKAVFPGGPSNAILPAHQADLPLDFSALKMAGSGLGTGAVIVMSEAACMVRVAIQYARFFARESCGQCPPCVLGLTHLSEIMEQIEAGRGSEKEVRQVEQVCQMVKGRGLCYLLTGAAIAVESIFRHFKSEFEAHVGQRCPSADISEEALLTV